MKIKLNNVLVFYKKSAYEIYFLERKSHFLMKNSQLEIKEKERLKQSHFQHYKTIETIEKSLKSHKIKFNKFLRGSRINFDKFDFVISVGGDGTFLQAARNIKTQFILGVNSVTNYSVGAFCSANINNFNQTLEKIINRNVTPIKLHRLKLTVDNLENPVNFLNDILICQENPAAMCRYIIKINNIEEEHRSSGVWIAPSGGSTGAIKSAGGRCLAKDDPRFQYLIRELYEVTARKNKLTGGILNKSEQITITSMMRKGMIYVDGAHKRIPFPFGRILKVSNCSCALNSIKA